MARAGEAMASSSTGSLTIYRIKKQKDQGTKWKYQGPFQAKDIESA